MSRRPLVRPSEEEVRRLQTEMGLDADNMPLGLAEDERKAAQDPGLPGKEPAVTFPPAVLTVSKIIAGIAGIALLALPAIAGVPAWVTFAVFAIGAIASLIAGLGAPSPFKGRPILTGGAAATVGAIAVGLFEIVTNLPDGFAKNALLTVAFILAAAAGVVLPQLPTKAAKALVLLPALVVGGTAYAGESRLGNGCSITATAPATGSSASDADCAWDPGWFLSIQCDVAVYFTKDGSTPTSASPRIAVGDPYRFRATGSAVQILPVTGSATCNVYRSDSL